MVQGKILKHLGGREFVIEIPELEERPIGLPSTKEVYIQHDFIQFCGETSYYMQADKNGGYPIKTRGASNHLSTKASLQIGIRDFKEFYLPMIMAHPYFQEEHLKDRIHSEDDQYWEKKGLSEPRFKKGDKYPAYAYGASVIQYYDKANKQTMVSFRAKGETTYSTLSLKIYNQIKGSLDLYKINED